MHFRLFVLLRVVQSIHAVSTEIPTLDSPDLLDDDAEVLVNGRPHLKPIFESTVDSEAFTEEPFSELEDKEIPLTEDSPVDRYRRYVLDVPRKTWTNGIIPYKFDDNLDNNRIKAVKNVFAVIEYWTHFRFVPWNSSVPEVYELHHENYLIFIRSTSCWSYVGNIRGMKGQKISCCTGTSCLHELGHAIGLHHEHSNPLRDRYIRINYDNVAKRMIPWFNTRQGSTDRGFGYFDLSSVMAYPSTTFSKNKREVITVYDPEMTYLLNRKDSTGYYMFYEAQNLYNMKGQKCPNTTRVCENGGYLSYIDGQCSCRCPCGLEPDTGCTTVITGTSKTKCGGMIHLSDQDPTHNFYTVGYPSLSTGKQSCTWFIKGPPKTQIALDFLEFDIRTNDGAGGKCDGHLEIRHLMPGQPGKTYCGRGFQKTIVSEGNTLSLLLRTSNPAKFNATVRHIKDLCYTNGGLDNSYAGTLNVTEDFRPCLHWDQVTHCRMNTFNVDHVDLIENYCRNPGYGSRPWCYVDPDTCARAYCDVCQIRRCFDMFDDCGDLIKSDKTYCTNDPEAIRGCRKTCGHCDLLGQDIMETHCDSPPSVPDADMINEATSYSTYKVGDTITYRCRTNTNITTNSTCTTAGTWTYVPYVCQDTNMCADKRLDCVQLLERNPRICCDRKDFVRQKCSRTCGLCGVQSDTYCRDYSFTHNTVDLSLRYAKPGEVISKACEKGYQLLSGDLYRACKPDSTLTGQPPVCVEESQITSGTYHVPIRRRKYTGKTNKAIILNNEYYKIDRQGEITAWKFYSNYPGRVVFQVWNYEAKNKRYVLKGQNLINDTKADRIVQYDVPKSQRINVYPGQLLGLYYYSRTPGGIPYDPCVTQYDPHGDGVVQIHIPGEIPKLNSIHTNWNSLSCRLFSFSAIIGPRTVKPISVYRWLDVMDFVHDYMNMLKKLSTLFVG